MNSEFLCDYTFCNRKAEHFYYHNSHRVFIYHFCEECFSSNISFSAAWIKATRQEAITLLLLEEVHES